MYILALVSISQRFSSVFRPGRITTGVAQQGHRQRDVWYTLEPHNLHYPVTVVGFHSGPGCREKEGKRKKGYSKCVGLPRRFTSSGNEATIERPCMFDHRYYIYGLTE